MAPESVPIVDATGRGVPPVWRSNPRNRVPALPRKEFAHVGNPLPTAVASTRERIPPFQAAAASGSVPAACPGATIDPSAGDFGRAVSPCRDLQACSFHPVERLKQFDVFLPTLPVHFRFLLLYTGFDWDLLACALPMVSLASGRSSVFDGASCRCCL